jgi:hypothetical protein
MNSMIITIEITDTIELKMKKYFNLSNQSLFLLLFNIVFHKENFEKENEKC